MTLVIDASVALKWVLDEPGSDAAFALQGDDLFAPALWLLESANALWIRVQRGPFDADWADRRLKELVEAPVKTTPVEMDVEAALGLAAALRHPVYDCLYLACALRLGGQVVTADKGFLRATSARPDLADRVRLLGAP